MLEVYPKYDNVCDKCMLNKTKIYACFTHIINARIICQGSFETTCLFFYSYLDEAACNIFSSA